MSKTKIEWTEETWNPTTGCTKVSSGCKNCYAERLSSRLQHMGVRKYQDAFKLRLHPDTLKEPYSWKKRRIVFVNSMSDLFHEDIPLSFIQDVFHVMNNNQKHIFQILTKRSERLREVCNELKWTDNIWMGVTVEDEKQKQRIDDLIEIPARIKFLSCEPLLSDLGDIQLNQINWVIVGGESGPKAREMKKEWVENILRQTTINNIPFFFKQWGGVNKKKNGRLLNEKIYSDMPSITDTLQSPY